MIWKRTLPCVLSACFFGAVTVFLAALSIVLESRPYMTAALLERIQVGVGFSFLLWLLCSILTGFAASSDCKRYFSREIGQGPTL